MDIESSLHFYEGIYYEDYFYFSSVEYNSLFRLKRNDTEAEHIGEFLEEDYFQENLHSQVIIEDDKLYFVPYDGHGISIYDTAKKEFDFVSLAEGNNNVSYVRAFQFKGKWLLIPSNGKVNFIRFDPKSRVVSICERLKEEIEVKLDSDYRIDIRGTICIDGRLYMVFFDTSYILEINIKNEQMKWHDIGGAHLANIEFDDKFFWLTTLSGDIYRWDCETDVAIKYTVHESSQREFMCCVSWNDKLYLIPNKCDYLWEYNYESNRWESLESSMPKEFHRELEGFSLMMGYGVIDNQLILFPRSGNGALVISNDNRIIYKKMITKCLIKKKLINKKIEQFQEQGDILIESQKIGLCDYIESIVGVYSSGS